MASSVEWAMSFIIKQILLQRYGFIFHQEELYSAKRLIISGIFSIQNKIQIRRVAVFLYLLLRKETKFYSLNTVFGTKIVYLCLS